MERECPHQPQSPSQAEQELHLVLLPWLLIKSPLIFFLPHYFPGLLMQVAPRK